MSDYHIDQPSHEEIIKHLRDMDAVLKEIAVTYELLATLLEKHSQALSAPSIDERRAQLARVVQQAAQRAGAIASAVQTLGADSERVVNHIQTLEAEL